MHYRARVHTAQRISRPDEELIAREFVAAYAASADDIAANLEWPATLDPRTAAIIVRRRVPEMRRATLRFWRVEGEVPDVFRVAFDEQRAAGDDR